MINSARLIEQFTQADGYLASQNPFSVFGNPDQMKSQTMLGMRSSPVFLHYTLKYATKTGLRPALSGGTTGGHSSPALKGWGFLPDLINLISLYNLSFANIYRVSAEQFPRSRSSRIPNLERQNLEIAVEKLLISRSHISNGSIFQHSPG